jgi:hypothetical protein
VRQLITGMTAALPQDRAAQAIRLIGDIVAIDGYHDLSFINLSRRVNLIVDNYHY